MVKINYYKSMPNTDYAAYVMYCFYIGEKPQPQH
jgi:hypothetical protein